MAITTYFRTKFQQVFERATQNFKHHLIRNDRHRHDKPLILLYRRWSFRRLYWLLALTPVLLSGCATFTVDELTQPPVDWPKLKVIEHRLPFSERTEACGGSMGRTIAALFIPGISIPVGCSRVNFDKGTCEIWIPEEPEDEIEPHERGHCEGRDHPGRTYFRDLWERYKNRHVSRGILNP